VEKKQWLKSFKRKALSLTMRYLIPFLLIIIACTTNPNGEVNTEKHLVILPAADSSAVPYTGWKTRGLWNTPLYIGLLRDTIHLFDPDTAFNKPLFILSDNDSIYIKSKSQDPEFRIKHRIFDRTISPDKKISDSMLVVHIDTSVFGKFKSYHLLDFGFLNEDEFNLDSMRKVFYSFHPVLITNQSTDSLFFFSPELYLEAKNSKDQWKTIGYASLLMCLTGEPEYFVAPGETMILPAPVYSGTFETRFRWYYEYADKKFYSEEYVGRINPKIFR
jgi:hypothetical protein